MLSLRPYVEVVATDEPARPQAAVQWLVPDRLFDQNRTAVPRAFATDDVSSSGDHVPPLK